MTETAWGSVFSEATDRRVEEFTESVGFDRRLCAQDVAGSIAHARMLATGPEQVRTQIELWRTRIHG